MNAGFDIDEVATQLAQLARRVTDAVQDERAARAVYDQADTELARCTEFADIAERNFTEALAAARRGAA